MIDSLQGRISTERQTLQSLIESPYGMGGAPNTGNLADTLNNLNRQLDKLQKLKADYDQELAALQAFVDDTAPLFKDSSQTFKDAMRGVAAINSSRANIDGSITFPKGTDMKWAKALKKDKLDSGLDPNTLPVSYRVKVTKIQNDNTLSAQQKADKIEKVYEDWLYSLDPKGFKEYAAARKKYNKNREEYEKKHGKNTYNKLNADPGMIAADKKLSMSLHNTHVNIRTVAQSLGDDVSKISDSKSYTQFYGMVQTDHPLDLKNRKYGKDTYSIWSRGWDGNPKEKNGYPSSDFLGNYLYGYYGRSVGFDANTLHNGASFAQVGSDLGNRKLNFHGDNAEDAAYIDEGIKDHDNNAKKNATNKKHD